jgi:hypothetical protein
LKAEGGVLGYFGGHMHGARRLQQQALTLQTERALPVADLDRRPL